MGITGCEIGAGGAVGKVETNIDLFKLDSNAPFSVFGAKCEPGISPSIVIAVLILTGVISIASTIGFLKIISKNVKHQRRITKNSGGERLYFYQENDSQIQAKPAKPSVNTEIPKDSKYKTCFILTTIIIICFAFFICVALYGLAENNDVKNQVSSSAQENDARARAKRRSGRGGGRGNNGHSSSSDGNSNDGRSVSGDTASEGGSKPDNKNKGTVKAFISGGVSSVGTGIASWAVWSGFPQLQAWLNSNATLVGWLTYGLGGMVLIMVLLIALWMCIRNRMRHAAKKRAALKQRNNDLEMRMLNLHAKTLIFTMIIKVFLLSTISTMYRPKYR